MIELTPLARPYAKAMFAAAIEDSSLESTSKELETIALAANSPKVTSAIENPSLSITKSAILTLITIGLLFLSIVFLSASNECHIEGSRPNRPVVRETATSAPPAPTGKTSL